jgi:hypothetical protein
MPPGTNRRYWITEGFGDDRLLFGDKHTMKGKVETLQPRQPVLSEGHTDAANFTPFKSI